MRRRLRLALGLRACVRVRMYAMGRPPPSFSLQNHRAACECMCVCIGAYAGMRRSLSHYTVSLPKLEPQPYFQPRDVTPSVHQSAPAPR